MKCPRCQAEFEYEYGTNKCPECNGVFEPRYDEDDDYDLVDWDDGGDTPPGP